MSIRLIATLLIVLLAAAAPSLSQTPLGTAFTYQGQLKNAGQPFNGPADLVFDLYDASAGGSLLGSHALNGVAVTNGLFTVVLNAAGQFGVSAFVGEQRWLQISVNGTPLAPRQELTAVPNALFALNADRLDGLNSTAFLQSIPVPLTLSGTIDGHVIRGDNASTLAASVGVHGRSTATSGITFGVRGESDSTSGRGVSGYASRTSGINYGVYGSTESTSGRAVFGQALNLTGSTYGGYFQSSSTLGIGAYGIGNFYGIHGESSSSTGRGVYGYASGPGVNNGTGVYGRNDSANGWAVFAQGKLGASGTKSFRIDHPDDPENRYLLHYSTESPEVLNFYSGNVILDGAGRAVVELPHYFSKINSDPRYMLTAIGAPMPTLHVAQEIDEAALSAGATAEPAEAAPICSFRIAGGAPGAKVSWRVEAVRNDRWVQQRGAPVEVEKQSLEKGTYQHPELYGQPPEMGMNYHVEHERPSPPVQAPATPH